MNNVCIVSTNVTKLAPGDIVFVNSKHDLILWHDFHRIEQLLEQYDVSCVIGVQVFNTSPGITLLHSKKIVSKWPWHGYNVIKLVATT